jgi:uncharacterized protein YjbJ (UPF0337 family)
MSAKTNQVMGRIKQTVGSLTGNKSLERAGRADRRSSDVKRRLTAAKAKVNELLGKAGNAVRRSGPGGQDRAAP